MKAAFLDRDGVINEEVNYLHKIEDFKYIPRCIEALSIIKELGYQIVIVTNQAGIARGYYSEKEYELLTRWYLGDLKEKGIDVLEVVHCPHHPDGVVKDLSIKCQCRKPNTGLIDEVVSKYGIDLESSFLVGDKLTDLTAARRAGIKSRFLVESGHKIDEVIDEECTVLSDLFEVARFLEKSVQSI